MRAISGWIVVFVVLGLNGVANPQSASPREGSAKQKLLGAWKLAWEEEEGTDGKMIRSTDHKGTIVYTADGHMSVQIILPRNGEDRRVNNPVTYNQGGYEAYYGSYDIDEKAHSVTHHVQGSLVPALIGKDLTRVYRFEGNQLILKSSRPDEHWTIVWEHF